MKHKVKHQSGPAACPGHGSEQTVTGRLSQAKMSNLAPLPPRGKTERLDA